MRAAPAITSVSEARPGDALAGDSACLRSVTTRKRSATEKPVGGAVRRWLCSEAECRGVNDRSQVLGSAAVSAQALEAQARRPLRTVAGSCWGDSAAVVSSRGARCRQLVEAQLREPAAKRSRNQLALMDGIGRAFARAGPRRRTGPFRFGSMVGRSWSFHLSRSAFVRSVRTTSRHLSR